MSASGPLARCGRGLGEARLRRRPVLENAEHGRVARVPGQGGGVEDLLADDEAGARAAVRGISYQPIGHVPSHWLPESALRSLGRSARKAQAVCKFVAMAPCAARWFRPRNSVMNLGSTIR